MFVATMAKRRSKFKPMVKPMSVFLSVLRFCVLLLSLTVLFD